MKLSIALPIAFILSLASALPTTNDGASYNIQPLGVDARNAPELVARYGESPAEQVSSEPASLEKRFSKITLCGGVELATQCAGASGGFASCSNTHFLKILDESQRIVFNQARVYTYNSVKGLGENPCDKWYYGGNKGDETDAIHLFCGNRAWKDLKSGETFATALIVKILELFSPTLFPELIQVVLQLYIAALAQTSMEVWK
ncbi:hypothetical protein BJ508DRAFT_315266 [Ascobolus immersus RN42]|uniref:Ecp2 effector protein domain-containing protein n=1 Tax=Ascobolus immersus RN42 TaxID=1160509 RepID=A0A3N4HIK8_ASCIM|nr:hypothetical protein BJ508DRAFT_315266 [Ascobolus immersus RN42]